MDQETKDLLSKSNKTNEKVMKLIQNTAQIDFINVFNINFTCRKYRMITLMIILVYHVYVPSTVIYIYQNRHDFLEIMNLLALIDSGIQASFKSFILYYFRDDFLHIHALMKRAINNALVKQHGEHLVYYSNLARITVLCTLVSYFGSVIALSLPREGAKLPALFHIPYMPYEESPYFEINYAFHFWLMVSTTAKMFTVDVLFVVYIFHICSQFKIIHYDLSLLGSRNEKIPGCETDKKLIKRCYLMHLEIIEFINIVRQLYMKIMFLEFFCVALTVSASMTRITTLGVDGTIIYIFATMVELFLSCVYGELLITESDNMLSKAYENEWYLMSIEDQRSLIIIMSNVQVPITLSALGVIDLSLVNFIAVVKTAYSWYTILTT